MRIVVVEDEERLRLGLSRLVESIDECYKVVGAASNGEEGARLIRRLMPDLALVDIRMPVMDGLAMIEALRSDGSPTCSFVIVSAYSDFEYARSALRCGVSDYLLKPITYEDVERVLLAQSAALSPSPFGGGSIEETHPVPADANALVREAVRLIQSEYNNPLSLDSVSSRLAVTPEYLSQLFSKQIGIPFTAYLKAQRVDIAKRLLLKGGMQVQDVAGLVGYQNVKYFNRVFKEITEYSPTEFIQHYRNAQGR